MEQAIAHPRNAPGAVILFDGVCNFCNGSVNFVIDRDPKSYFRFAALQSAPARELLRAHDLPADDLKSMVLVEDGRAYTRSDAAFRIMRHLRLPWKLLSALLLVPRPLRNWGYNIIARNRYRWFGKTDACRVPTPEIAGRFLS
ncbi:MAG: thiol-disulfide oxidoreductase DCC family protein [Tepidisphaeraceae bacterium]